MTKFPSLTLTFYHPFSQILPTCGVVNCFDSLDNCIRNLFPYQYLKSDFIVFNGCCVWICHNSLKQVLVFHSNDQSGNEHPGTYVFALLTHYFLKMNSQKLNCWVTRAPHWKTPDTIVQMWEGSCSKEIGATLCPVFPPHNSLTSPILHPLSESMEDPCEYSYKFLWMGSCVPCAVLDTVHILTLVILQTILGGLFYD